MIIFLESFVLPGMAFGTCHFLTSGVWAGAIALACAAAIICVGITEWEKLPDE